MSKILVEIVEHEGVTTVLKGTSREGAQKLAKSVAKNVPPKPKLLEGLTLAAAAKAVKSNIARMAMTKVTDALAIERRIIDKVAGAASSPFWKKLTQSDWALILKKARHVLLKAVDDVDKYVKGVKGLILELAVRKSDDLEILTQRLLKKIPKTGKWDERIHVVFGATTVTEAGVGELGDILLVTYSKTDPKKVWILGIVESKAESNALDLTEKLEKWYGNPDLPGAAAGKQVTATGQLLADVERLKVFGVEIPGVGKFQPDDVVVSAPKKSLALTDDRQVTELIGVLPPDTKSNIQNRIASKAPSQGVQIWKHSIEGQVATKSAKEILAALTGR